MSTDKILRLEFITNGKPYRINFDLTHRDAGQPLAEVTARALTFLATDQKVAYRVLEDRAAIIDSAVRTLTTLLNKEFAKLDTLDGYPTI